MLFQNQELKEHLPCLLQLFYMPYSLLSAIIVNIHKFKEHRILINGQINNKSMRLKWRWKQLLNQISKYSHHNKNEIQIINKKMDQIDLFDIRRRLHDWRNHSPQIVFSLLESISQHKASLQQVNQIYNTVQALSQVKLEREMHKPSMFEWNEYKRVIERAAIISKQLHRILTEKQMEIEGKLQNKLIIPQKKVKLFQGYQEQFNGYVERLPYLNALGNALLLHSYSEKNVKEVCVGLEKEIYLKNMMKESRKMSYEMDVKTLLQYFKRDKKGTVIAKLFTGGLSFNQAAQLQSDDWIDEDTRKQQIQVQQAELEAQKTGFYDEVQKREMEGVEGKKCKGCGEKKVYLVGEQQTRASDEPTTKFFKCLNCGDKFRIC